MLKAKWSTLWDAQGSAFWETPLGFLEARKGERIANWRDHPKLENSLYKKWFFWLISCLARGSPIWRAPRRRTAAWRVLEGKERRIVLPGLLLKGKWRRIALPGLLKNVPQKEYPFGGHREHHLGSQMKYPLGAQREYPLGSSKSWGFKCFPLFSFENS